VGRFVKKLNDFARDYFGDGLWVDFHYAMGEHGGSFNVCLWKKMVQFYKGPKFGVEISVW
jgi:hypothetical protein